MTPRKAVLLALAATFGGFALFAWSGTGPRTISYEGSWVQATPAEFKAAAAEVAADYAKADQNIAGILVYDKECEARGTVPTNIKQYAARYLKTRKAQVTAEIDTLYAKANKAAKLEKTSREIGLIVWCHLVEPEMTQAFKQAAKFGNL
jgi:lipocalin